tara:strand:+ start:2871 stop:3044 length:174 start_codon:yes stop_codon:yes gene_type:complete
MVKKDKKVKRILYLSLKYCEKCKYVWEKSSTGSIIYHSDLPTYKLPRINCKNCKGKK